MMTPEIEEAFRRAFGMRDAKAVRDLLARHPPARAAIDEPLFPFDSPALVACADQPDMVEVLLEFGADPNRRSDWWAGGFHPLHAATGAAADRLIAAGSIPDACAAAHLDRVDLLRPMLEEDPSRVHERGGDGQTPLHFARSREVVDLLLGHGADIDARDIDHRSTPAQWMLERARDRGRYDLARYLVERGASVDVFLAAALGLTDVLQARLERDPSLQDLRTGQGEYGAKPPSSYHIYFWTIGPNRSPVQVAEQFGHRDAMDVLHAAAGPRQHFLAACAAGDVETAGGLIADHPRLMDELTPGDHRVLADAAWAPDPEAVAFLLGLGFDPAAEGHDGGTALHCASWVGSAPGVHALLADPRGRALVNVRDATYGSTPLGWCIHGAQHCASPGGDYAAVTRLLLTAGAKPDPGWQDAPAEVRAVFDEA